MVKTFITTVVAHIDHGKTTLIDSLISATGHISKTVAGEIRYLDTRSDEQTRGITLKLSAIELFYKHKYIIIDTPGHVDFESLVEISSRLSDSFIIIVDINEGITPRLFSIAKFITKNTILVINKIDKQLSKSVDEIHSLLVSVIIRVNSLVKEELFSWDRNNVIIAWSTMCVGVSKNELKKISEHCGLKNCVKFLVELNKRIVANQVDKVCSKFNIKNRDPKSIWSGVLPLARVLFEAIESNFDVKESANQKLQGLTMYCKLKNPKELRLDNLLFMLRLFSGTISENDEIVCKDRNGERTVKIDELYKFNVSNLKRIEACEAPGLLLAKANLAKHSLVYSVDNEDGKNDDLCTISQKPFYKANISLHDSAETDRFKEALKTLSYLEPILKVKLNKYGEYEFFCEGKVQFEKICQDLSDNDFSFTVCKQKMNFREMCGSEEAYKGDVNVSVKHSTELPNDYTCIKGTSTLLCLTEKYADIAKCAFEYIVSHGPLVDEQIEFTHFTIDIDQSKNFDDPFNAIKKGLISAYIQTTPRLIPLYFQCRIQAGLDYIGNVYKSLHKYSYTLKNEVYDSEMEFFEVFIYIPQCQYYDFVEDLRMKTKGTCYIEFEEYGYMINEKHRFTEHIEMIKKSKGMFTEDLAVADPEKQRTLKK